MDIDTLIEELIHREGGYTNYPADRGGPTRWGVTQMVARAHGYEGDMRHFPRELAAEVYRRIYWLAPHFDRVAGHAPKVAAELFDTGVNMGPTAATASCAARSMRSIAARRIITTSPPQVPSTTT
jgi:lysozyme family protein